MRANNRSTVSRRLKPGAGGKEAQCAADHSPINTPTDLAECLRCWKEAELAEFLAIENDCSSTSIGRFGSTRGRVKFPTWQT